MKNWYMKNPFTFHTHAYIASQLSLISIGVTVMNGFPVTAHSILVLAWVFTVGCPS